MQARETIVILLINSVLLFSLGLAISCCLRNCDWLKYPAQCVEDEQISRKEFDKKSGLFWQSEYFE